MKSTKKISDLIQLTFAAFRPSFQPFERKMSYVKASSFCEERGAHLVSVHSVRENDLIKTEIRKRK